MGQESNNTLIFDRTFGIIYGKKVLRVSIVAEKKEKQYVSDNFLPETDKEKGVRTWM